MDQTLLPIRDPLSITTIQAKTSAGVTIKDSGGTTIATIAAAGDTDLVIAGAHAASSAGFHIHNASGQDTAIFGAGGGQGTTFYGQVNGTSLSLSSGITCTTLTASALGQFTVGDASVGLKVAGSTGKIRFRGYVDGTIGSLVESLNAAEGAYLPLTLFGSVVRLAPDGTAALTLSSSAPGTPGATEVLIGGGQIKAGAGITCTTLTASGIAKAGSLGIGIAGSPARPLDVYGSAQFKDASGIATTLWSEAVTGAGGLGTNTNHPFAVLVNGSEVARWETGGLAAGKMSIGYTTTSTSTTTGCATFGGGIGVAGAGYFGAGITCTTLTMSGTSASTTAGILQVESGQDHHYAYTNGIGGWVDKCLFSQYASVTQSGIVTSQSLASVTAKGTRTLPANFFKQGKVLKFRLCGRYTTDGTPGNATVDIKLGSTTFRTTGSYAMDASSTNQPWEIEGEITCYTTGATGTIEGVAWWAHGITGATGNFNIEPMAGTGTVTIDTTASQAFDVQWTATDAGTSITCSCFRLWEVC